MLDNFPYYSILARQATEPRVGWTVEVRIAQLDEPLPGVSEQDVIDTLRACFAAQPNVNLSVSKADIANTPV